MHRSIDGIVWTLNVEVKFYLVCVAVATLLRRGSRAVFVSRLVVLTITAYASEAYANSGQPLSLAVAFLCLSVQLMNFMFIGVVFNFWLVVSFRGSSQRDSSSRSASAWRASGPEPRSSGSMNCGATPPRSSPSRWRSLFATSSGKPASYRSLPRSATRLIRRSRCHRIRSAQAFSRVELASQPVAPDHVSGLAARLRSAPPGRSADAPVRPTPVFTLAHAAGASARVGPPLSGMTHARS